MDTTTFWTIIKDTRDASNGDMTKQPALLTDELVQLPEQDILEFNRIFWEMKARAYRADLWEACYVIGCGCSDDGFDDFRGWLIAQGQTIYENALADPESLADVVTPDTRYDTHDGRITDVPDSAYERKTGQKVLLPGYSKRPVLIGTLEQDNGILPQNYPRISATLGECDE